MTTQRVRRAWRGLAAVVLVAGCALGFRGEAPFAGEHDLHGTTEIRIDLPDTPLHVEACTPGIVETCEPALRYNGIWHAVAGSPGDARSQAAKPVLLFERDDGFASLRAEIPLAVEGIVDLEMDTILVPDDVHLDLRTGVGDVTVLGSEATVVIEVDAGDVEVQGAAGGLAVNTGQGDLEIVTGGHADLRTASGHVRVEQSGDPRDLLVDTKQGDITVTLASDADIDLEIRTRGTIRVRTASITTVTSGSFHRENGNGSIRVQLVSPRGEIEVVQPASR